MAAPANQRRGGSGLRSSLVVIGALLGILAICLIVFGTSNPRQLLIGIIVGLWAALLAAFGLPGLKRAAPEIGADLQSVRSRIDEVEQAQLRATQDGLAATQQSIAAQGVEIRRLNELQLARETAARRESDLALQVAIRREIEQTVADQFTGLREEVTALRAEVLENLGGQIKLERIETTRVIGSDLEALQDEIRRLATQQQPQMPAWAAEPTSATGTQNPQMPVRAVFGERSVSPDTAALTDTSAYPDLPEADIVDAEIVEPTGTTVAPPVVPVIGDPEPAPVAPATEAAASGFDPSWGPVRSVRTKAARLTVPDPPPPPPVPAPPAPEPVPMPAPEPLPMPKPLPTLEPLPTPAPEPLPPLEPPPAYRSRGAGGLNAGGLNVGGLNADSRDPFADLPRLSPVPPDLLGLSGRRRAPEASVGPGPADPASAVPAPADPERAYPERAYPPSEESTGEIPVVHDARGSGRRRAPGHASMDQPPRARG